MSSHYERAEEETLALVATVEKVRAASYPQLDEKLVSAILEVQRRYAEDRAEAQRRTDQLINQWVASQTTGRD